MTRLTASFYLRDDVVAIAQELLGTILVTEWEGVRTTARIVETEAYRGPEDKASHAYNNRRTARTEVMFGPGGHAYVYLCYGIHHLFNVVTGPAEIPHAVLVRAVEPLVGIDIMMARRQRTQPKKLTSGPGLVGQALGLSTIHSGLALTTGDSIWIEAQGLEKDEAIVSSPRIGVDYAGECATWPWRFYLAGNPWVSGKRNV